MIDIVMVHDSNGIAHSDIVIGIMAFEASSND